MLKSVSNLYLTRKTHMVINPSFVNQDGSEFESKDIPDEEECDRPFLYVE